MYKNILYSRLNNPIDYLLILSHSSQSSTLQQLPPFLCSHLPASRRFCISWYWFIIYCLLPNSSLGNVASAFSRHLFPEMKRTVIKKGREGTVHHEGLRLIYRLAASRMCLFNMAINFQQKLMWWICMCNTCNNFHYGFYVCSMLLGQHYLAVHSKHNNNLQKTKQDVKSNFVSLDKTL